MVDAATQRLNMVESQVLTSDVTDRRILRAMRELPRERFVPAPMTALAYMDEAVPVTPAGAERRWLLAPRVLAKLLQLADIGDDNHVLDVGGATGYSAARACRHGQDRRRPREQHQARRAGAGKPCRAGAGERQRGGRRADRPAGPKRLPTMRSCCKVAAATVPRRSSIN